MLARIGREFGPRVAGIVEACSDSFESTKRPWEERKRPYIERLSAQPASVKLVVACDKLDNLRATADDLERDGIAVLEKFSAPPARLRWYYTECFRSVRDALPAALAARLGHELDRVTAWIPA